MKKLLLLLFVFLVGCAAKAQDTTKLKPIPVILECARKDIISARFFVPAIQIGDKFFYSTRRNQKQVFTKFHKPLPKHWEAKIWKTL